MREVVVEVHEQLALTQLTTRHLSETQQQSKSLGRRLTGEVTTLVDCHHEANAMFALSAIRGRVPVLCTNVWL